MKITIEFNATETDRQTDRQTDTNDEWSTDANVEVNDVILVHVCDALADLTQPTDALHLTVVLHLNGSRQQIDAGHTTRTTSNRSLHAAT